MAGNVATYAGADNLASCGADIIKVGIGGGSACLTRETGFGVPNLTAIRKCAKVDRSIVADGVIRTPGDIVGGLRSGLTYGGAANIRELQRKLDYIRITRAGRIEGQAHKALGLPE